MLIARRKWIAGVAFLGVVALGWVYWSQPKKIDLAQYAPPDTLMFVEANDFGSILQGIEQTHSWRALAGPLGAPSQISPNRWWIRLARWTGIGATDAILFSRSQVAVIFSGSQGSELDGTLTIKPLATFVIETHTSQWRMRKTIEGHIEDVARRIYKNPVAVKKTINNHELQEWTSDDGTRQIVVAFIDTAVIVGNDETLTLRAIQARTGGGQSLRDNGEFIEARNRVSRSDTSLFGFVSQAGVKSLLQAFALQRNRSSPDAVAEARIFADTFGGIIKNGAWSASFSDGLVEDRCSIKMADGVTDKLRPSITPDRGPDFARLKVIPQKVHSFSVYQFHDPVTLWSDLKAAVSAHADLVGAMAARPLLRSLLKPYGIEDPEGFLHASGTRLLTIRLEDGEPAVLVAEAIDQPALRKIAGLRLGPNPKTERLGDAEMISSATGEWAAAFLDQHFFIGPFEAVRRCLNANTERQSVLTSAAFRKSQVIVNTTLPMFGLTFTNDEAAAISFIELFSARQQSAFATTAAEVQRAAQSLPMAMSATLIKDSTVEWTCRSSFGIGGGFAVQLFPENSR